MNQYRYERAALTVATARAQGVDFLAADFSVAWGASLVRLSLAVASAVPVFLVPSSGSNFALNGGNALPAGAVYTEQLVLDSGRTWNFNTDDASGTTVLHLVVSEVSQ